MAKLPITPEFKIQVCERYLKGEGSFKSLAKEYGIGKTTIRRWVKKYQIHGKSCFCKSPGNNIYSKEFKLKCIEEVLFEGYPIDDVVAKYNISSFSVLYRWITMYNANMGLKDYNQKREVYMAESRRKTTFEERKEITEYCIAHDNDYKNTAALFDVSYSQVYMWVKKYREKGEEGLKDKRGHHKTDDELSELERLRRENARLKKQLEEEYMYEELLKKVEEFERR